MSIIPLHLQRRFEQRWASQFGSLTKPLKGSPVNITPRAAKQKEQPDKPARSEARLLVEMGLGSRGE